MDNFNKFYEFLITKCGYVSTIRIQTFLIKKESNYKWTYYFQVYASGKQISLPITNLLARRSYWNPLKRIPLIFIRRYWSIDSDDPCTVILSYPTLVMIVLHFFLFIFRFCFYFNSNYLRSKGHEQRKVLHLLVSFCFFSIFFSFFSCEHNQYRLFPSCAY